MGFRNQPVAQPSILRTNGDARVRAAFQSAMKCAWLTRRIKEVADGELGEIVLRGENILKGYYRNEEATQTAFRNGWFHTGDIGYRDADGFFYIVDRKSDMIIRGGENIYPREIDEVFISTRQLLPRRPIGVPDSLYGEEVAAFVVLKEGREATEEEIITFAGSDLRITNAQRQFASQRKFPKALPESCLSASSPANFKV